MFRQISVYEEDRDLTRILWSPSPEIEPQDLRLTTVTYGTVCAPFLANRTLRQLAEDESTRYPRSAKRLKKNTYVDDTYAGEDELAEAIETRNELVNILGSAGIKLDKWAANHPLLMPSDNNSSHEMPVKSLNEDEFIKTLGVIWQPHNDAFSFHVKIPGNQDPEVQTKRSVLSAIARLFDPLGWLSPVTAVAKILLQDLWIQKTDWDSPLPAELLQRWQDYCTSLAEAPVITINRWLGTSASTLCEIHAFSDASKRAYATVLYLRVQVKEDQFQTWVLMSKTKVSPIKTISIPNLELMGAALLVKLVNHVRKLDFFAALPVYAWTDSQIVLSWLQKHPCNWKTFVANRVSYIQTELTQAKWRFVPTKENPADIASRGIRSTELRDSQLWWTGPSWLSKQSHMWPKHSENTQEVLQCLCTQDGQSINQYLGRFSSLTRLTRVTAYCLRFLSQALARNSNQRVRTPFLASDELKRAEILLIGRVQAETYQSEIRWLTNERTESLPPSKRSNLQKLRPYIDQNDKLLRVGGRLCHSSLTHEAKHPPILPRDSHLSRLFVRFAHLSSLHGGPILTMSILQQHVWITGAMRLVKAEIHNCVKCQHIKPRTVTQLMSDLPAARVNISRPFTYTGLDYAGPFQLRTTKGRGYRAYKGWVALFICFATKAIHLEAVSDMTSATFLAAYRRFVSRRGIPKKMYSDNGTTFKGAARELREMFDAASEFYHQVAQTLANEGTSWGFIPPNTPHCGGLWEAGVKATKHHFHRIVGDHTFTFEEFSTLLCEIETCLNSRPLYPMSNDPDDLAILTPSHFLIGTASGLIPDSEVPPVPENRLNRYQLLTRIRNNFWRRWSKEYLHHLQQRSKWRSPSVNFAVGQLVLIRDDDYPPSKWPLARIIETHAGSDGVVRIVTVKAGNKTVQRHVARLSPLYLPSDENETRTIADGGNH